MPEIKLGSSKNAKNINLGSKEIEEVRLGRILVWQNNIAPQIVLTTPQVGEYGDLNFPIGITVASNVNIIFSAQDLDPLDTIVSYAVDGPTGFTPVPTTPITPGNPVSGLTFTIPDTLFTNAGEPTTNNVFTVTVTDQRGKDGIYTVTVIGVSVPPPTISVRKEFGSKSALTSNGPQSASAEWVITQPSETSAAGYIAQYSYDNVNWSNYNGQGIYRSTTISCGGYSSVTVYCRSIKTGSTTANGNSASSTFSVSAPSVSFPVSLSNCVYSSLRVDGNTTSQTCGGVISGVGQLRTMNYVELRPSTGQVYTGTSFPNLYNNDNGDVTTPYYERSAIVRFRPTFIVPSVNGTTLSYTCQGGDYRKTTTNIPNQSMVDSIRGRKGTTGVGSLYNRGQDFRYTTLSINSPYVSISPPGVYGDTSYAASFNSVGTTNTKPIYGGDYRLAAGGTFNIGPGAQKYTRAFETYDTCPSAGTVLGDYCNGTIFTEQVADGNCGITFRKTQVVGKCGYTLPAFSSVSFGITCDGYTVYQKNPQPTYTVTTVVDPTHQIIINVGNSRWLTPSNGSTVYVQAGQRVTASIRKGPLPLYSTTDPGGEVLASVGTSIERKCPAEGVFVDVASPMFGYTST